jgi:hypothetical protein
MSAMPDTPHQAKGRFRDAVALASTQGLDTAVAGIESALSALWLFERQGAIPSRDVPNLVLWFASTLKKLAPPPPKKVKFSDPLRKILPLAETSVRPALDSAMIMIALTQVGDFTETPDKARASFDLFLDDWRRMTWESANIPDWKRFRELVNPEERTLEGRLSREATLQILEAIANRRKDNITPLPDLSILACARCGQFRGRDRTRCAQCKGSFCARCSAPTADLCLPEYATRYAPIAPDRRQTISANVRTILKGYRLDVHTRNEVFVRALHEEGVDVTFTDTAPLEGQEVEAKQDRRKLLVRDRESLLIKRVFFRALARCYFRAAGGGEPLVEDFFVDLCAGVPVEEALRPR